MKNIIFDMDGTLVDLYGEPDWHECLYDTFDENPYRVAKPMHDMSLMNSIIKMLKSSGYNIIIVSALSNMNKGDFHERIMQAKVQWLKEHGFDYDSIVFVKYGTNKYDAVRDLSGEKILVDDDDKVLGMWPEEKIDAKNESMLMELISLTAVQPLYA